MDRPVNAEADIYIMSLKGWEHKKSLDFFPFPFPTVYMLFYMLFISILINYFDFCYSYFYMLF